MNKKILRVRKKALIALIAIFGVAVLLVFFVLPAELERRLNASLNQPPAQISERAFELHNKLLICDMHADSLLWDRDLSERSVRGHVDVPRLIEGNVALQAFTVVTKTPYVWKMNIDSNDDSSDNITLIALMERWPVSTWNSLTERALYQARKLHDVEARSGGRFVIVRTSDDLSRYLERRTGEHGITAGFLGIEGAHALDGKLENVDALFDAGFRMMAPTHFFDNDIGGSAHGVQKGGLTEKGKEMVRRMEALRMTIDLAHASANTIDDVLAIATRPVVVSHTGVRGTCDNQRNLSDGQLKGIAQTGGVIGIGFWDTAVCAANAAAIATAIRYTADLVGVEHVGLGSDYDGAIVVPFDTTGLIQITEALIQQGFSDDEIRMIMGGNAIKLFLGNLPGSS